MRTDTSYLRSFRRGPRIATAAIALLGIAPAASSYAAERLSLEVARIDGPGWSADRLRIDARLGTRAIEVAATLEDAAGHGLTAQRITAGCAHLEFAGSIVACRQARLQGQVEGWPAQDLSGHLAYDRASGGLEFALEGLALADGRARVAGTWQSPAWQAEVEVRSVSAADLLALAGKAGPAPRAVTAEGRLSGRVDAAGVDMSLSRVAADLTFADLSAANEAGTLASEGLALTARGSAVRTNAAWSFDVKLTAPKGQFYLQPVFADLSQGALDLEATGRLTDDEHLHIERFALDHRTAVRATGSAEIQLAEPFTVNRLDMRVAEATLPAAWQTYVQPFFIDTALAALQSEGRLSGTLRVLDNAPVDLDLDLDSVSADDGAGTFAIAGLEGSIHWTAGDTEQDVEAEDSESDAPQTSHLEWRDGSLLGLAIGAARLEFTTRGRGVHLLAPVAIPVLDGSVDLEALRVRNVGTDRVAFLIGAEIRPISVARVCDVFGWPEFGGTLAGSIRKLRMREGVVTLGTTLEAHVFDGIVRIGDLKLEHPFGDWPKLYANIELEQLDLDQVTSAFEFGRITGRLGGEIAGLELFNWMPVAFDARLATPPGDRSRHRISQRAVENIGSLGGGSAGVTAALSSGFLKFFDDFNYDRLGITCRLRNEVCVMGGVAPADNGGYYLVKGKGLPRIDVIGNRTRVDWPRLVRQLVAIVESEGPVVE